MTIYIACFCVRDWGNGVLFTAYVLAKGGEYSAKAILAGLSAIVGSRNGVFWVRVRPACASAPARAPPV